jgi:hypothetical protein
MATQNYIFKQDMQVSGERVSNGFDDVVPMVTGDYGVWDTVTLKLTLYPRSGDEGLIVYVPTSRVAALVSGGVIGATAGVPGGLPTPR